MFSGLAAQGQQEREPGSRNPFSPQSPTLASLNVNTRGSAGLPSPNNDHYNDNSNLLNNRERHSAAPGTHISKLDLFATPSVSAQNVQMNSHQNHNPLLGPVVSGPPMNQQMNQQDQQGAGGYGNGGLYGGMNNGMNYGNGNLGNGMGGGYGGASNGANNGNGISTVGGPTLLQLSGENTLYSKVDGQASLVSTATGSESRGSPTSPENTLIVFDW